MSVYKWHRSSTVMNPIFPCFIPNICSGKQSCAWCRKCCTRKWYMGYVKECDDIAIGKLSRRAFNKIRTLNTYYIPGSLSRMSRMNFYLQVVYLLICYGFMRMREFRRLPCDCHPCGAMCCHRQRVGLGWGSVHCHWWICKIMQAIKIDFPWRIWSEL